MTYIPDSRTQLRADAATAGAATLFRSTEPVASVPLPHGQRSPLAARAPHLSLVGEDASAAPDHASALMFVEALPVIERIIAIIARRNALGGHDADEFRSWAQARMIDNDYAVFRKFGGRSSIATYLTAVLSHLFLDHRNSLWGRWRPCAAAERMGAIGIRLDELLHRDGCTLREAREILHSGGAEIGDRELNRMAAQLPVRRGSHELPLETLAGTMLEADDASSAGPADLCGQGALRDAVAALLPEDQVIVRMRFWDGVSVADIARSLRLDQKLLYRRLDAIEKRLRLLLAERGVDRERARDLLSAEVAW